MTQDILILLLPYLSAIDAKALFELCLTAEVLTSKDNGAQKRGYKILARLLESGKVDVDVVTVLKTLDGLLEGLNPAAKKVHHLSPGKLTLLTTHIGSVQPSVCYHPPSPVFCSPCNSFHDT